MVRFNYTFLFLELKGRIFDFKKDDYGNRGA